MSAAVLDAAGIRLYSQGYVRPLVTDPDDNIPIRAILQLLSNKQMPKVFPDTKLDVMLNIFQTGRSHLALVHDVNNDGPGDPYYFNIGILTLEDVLEELIMEEILDETDMGKLLPSFWFSHTYIRSHCQR